METNFDKQLTLQQQQAEETRSILQGKSVKQQIHGGLQQGAEETRSHGMEGEILNQEMPQQQQQQQLLQTEESSNLSEQVVHDESVNPEELSLKNEDTQVVARNRTREDLVMALDTALNVNKHLNGEVEKLISEMDQLKKGKVQAEEHAKELSQMLNVAKRDGKKDTATPTEPTRPKTPENEDDTAEEQAVLHGDKEWERLRETGAACGWLVDPSLVELGKAVAKGTFGQTYTAKWRGVQVAVKSVRVESRDEITSFLREVEVMSSVRHPCVLPFIGAVLSPPEQCWLLAEWMPGGTLAQWLRGDKKAGFPFKRRPLSERLQKSLEVACGMQALQESDPMVIHRDLKPSNVLIDAIGVARVADMGLSRRFTIETASVLTGETGTYLYMAPEVMKHDIYDSKADVFSWAVLTAELITQETPYHSYYMTPMQGCRTASLLRTEHAEHKQVALSVSSNQIRPVLPEATHPGVSKLLSAAWDDDPTKRPFFREIVRKMTKFIEHVTLDEKDQAQANAANSVGSFVRGLAVWGQRQQ